MQKSYLKRCKPKQAKEVRSFLCRYPLLFFFPINICYSTDKNQIFYCFTGLSYIDVKTLTTAHFEKDQNGRIWIKKRRIKTGVLSRIPLLPMAKIILEKYKGGDKLLPIQDPADINKYLKDIAILCNINKRITYHTSRHTFASTVTLANNISLEVVSKMLGHTNIHMTTHYAKLVDETIAKQMDQLADIFNE